MQQSIESVKDHEENDKNSDPEDNEDAATKSLTPEEKKERIKAKKKERKKKKQQEAKKEELERKVGNLEKLKVLEETNHSSKEVVEESGKKINQENANKPSGGQQENLVKKEEKIKTKITQTNPPKIPISTLFSDGIYPKGEICEYVKELYVSFFCFFCFLFLIIIIIPYEYKNFILFCF